MSVSLKKKTNGGSGQSSQSKRPVIGITLGGGGPFGGIYEIGALRAMDEALEGLDLNKLDHYVGVNAGAFVAANLANQITPAQMCRVFVRNEADVHPFHPGVFYYPAFDEYKSRLKAIPGLFSSAVLNLLKNPSDQSLLEYLTVMSQAVPAGVFDNHPFHEYMKRVYTSVGRTNDFRQLSRQLQIIATDLESGETVRFGSPGEQNISISKAIQASMASPGVYVPVAHQGRYYMDGTLNKGLHTSVAFDSGCDIVLAVNPIVPFGLNRDTATRGDRSALTKQVIRSGMGNVLSQSYRTMVHSRLYSGLKNVKRSYPDKDLFLFEPTKKQANIFFNSVFSFEARKLVCEQAYQATRLSLWQQADELEAKLAPVGVRVRRDILEDDRRTLSSGLYSEGLPVYAREQHEVLADDGKATSSLERISQRVVGLF